MRPCRIIAVIAALAATLLVAGPAGASSGTQVVVEPADERGPISPLLFGANHRFGYDGFGMFDPDANAVFPKFVDQSRAAGLSIIRFPGGTIANTYKWRRAIGPESERIPNIHGVARNGEPLENDFGVDEYGRYLEQIGAVGSIVVNFATGDAREAANWVEYMTSPVGANPNGGRDWAAVRARNGHPEPYDVPYWEVGNEMFLGGQRYWMRGEADIDCPRVDYACLYAFGGSTHITRQRAGRLTDHRRSAAESDGSAGQELFAKYGPVEPGSQTVFVDGEAWREVEDLSAAGAEDVYAFEPPSGRITFGDGERGNIPPEGAVVTVSYTSGPHDGFVDFYREMKAVNPDIRVCGSVLDSFMDVMGSEHPYDCVAKHTYVGQPWGRDVPADEYHSRLMLNADDQGREVAVVQDKAEQYAGERADEIGVVVTEYGQFRNSGPRGVERYMQSLDQGLHTANLLRNWIELGVPVAEAQALIDFVFAPPPTGDPTATNVRVIFAGPGPDTVPQGMARVFELFTGMTGDTHVWSRVLHNPVRPVAGEAGLPALETVASTGSDGELYVIVINQDPHEDVRADVLPLDYRHGGRAEVWTVNGESFLSYNTPDDLDNVTLTRRQRTVAAAGFEHTFPAHSVTAIRLDGALHAQPVELALEAPAGTERGGEVEVTATVTNGGDDDAAGEVALQAPVGWTVTPPRARYAVESARSVRLRFRVTVPDDAEYGRHQLSAVLYGPGPFVGDVAETTVGVWPPPPTADAWLSDLEWVSADNHWGPVERDMSNGARAAGDGSTITIEGQTYEKGLGVHAPSRIAYHLGGNCTRFISDVGVDDENEPGGSVRFEVRADGERIARTAVLDQRDAARTIDVDVSGIEILTLIVTDGGDGTGNDHADWAGARVLCGRH